MGGYSARYHAASLAAVFLALAIGILIGIGFGDDVVSGTTEQLEESLQNDVEEAREKADDLEGELDQEREFGEAVYPALVGDELGEERVVVIALGGLPGDVARDVEDAVEPAGANITEVAVVREPPDVGALAGELDDTRHARAKRNPEAVEALGRTVGRQLVLGGGVIRRVRAQLLSRFSGRLGRADNVVVVRDAPGELGERDAEATARLEDGILEGIRDTRLPAAGAEQTDTEESSIELFDSHDIPTVDNLDRIAGRVALVSVLLGAEGNYGVKDTSDELLPDLLPPERSGGPVSTGAP
ncbi:MAG: copper transporter [Solirubrobacterales bacterium]